MRMLASRIARFRQNRLRQKSSFENQPPNRQDESARIVNRKNAQAEKDCENFERRRRTRRRLARGQFRHAHPLGGRAQIVHSPAHFQVLRWTGFLL